MIRVLELDLADLGGQSSGCGDGAVGVSGRSAGVGVPRALVHPVGTHVEDTCKRINASTVIRVGQMVVFVHWWQNSHLRRK